MYGIDSILPQILEAAGLFPTDNPPGWSELAHKRLALCRGGALHTNR